MCVTSAAEHFTFTSAEGRSEVGIECEDDRHPAGLACCKLACCPGSTLYTKDTQINSSAQERGFGGMGSLLATRL